MKRKPRHNKGHKRVSLYKVYTIDRPGIYLLFNIDRNRNAKGKGREYWAISMMFVYKVCKWEDLTWSERNLYKKNSNSLYIKQEGDNSTAFPLKKGLKFFNILNWDGRHRDDAWITYRIETPDEVKKSKKRSSKKITQNT